jgi:hypothetical protein
MHINENAIVDAAGTRSSSPGRSRKIRRMAAAGVVGLNKSVLMVAIHDNARPTFNTCKDKSAAVYPGLTVAVHVHNADALAAGHDDERICHGRCGWWYDNLRNSDGDYVITAYCAKRM